MNPRDSIQTRTSESDNSTVNSFRQQFESELASNHPPAIEAWLNRSPVELKEELFIKLLQTELEFHQQRGVSLDPVAYCRRFPEYNRQIHSVFKTCQAIALNSSDRVSNASTMDRSGQQQETGPDRWQRGQLLGRYRLIQNVGHGSFGEVWKAVDPELNRAVAIKLPHTVFSKDSQVASRFRDEARRAATLKHDGIVPVYDIGEVGNGFFIVSEFVDGPTLAERLRYRDISRVEAIRIIHDLALILHKAHLTGLIHRDIKPSNILIRRDGCPTITDFGLAVSQQEQPSLGEGEVVGTLAYMSPEQARGDVQQLCGQSDLYSLGVILFQLLTNQLPFIGNDHEDLIKQIQFRQVRSLRSIDDSIPEALDAVCAKCLAKEIHDRYANGGELARALQRLQEDTSIVIQRPRSFSNFASGCLAVAVAGVLCVFISGQAWQHQPRDNWPGGLGAHAAASDRPQPSGESTETQGEDLSSKSARDASVSVTSTGQAESVAIVGTKKPAANQWLPLLNKSLEKTIWEEKSPTCFLQQDLKAAKLTAGTDGVDWILTSDLQGAGLVRFRGSVLLDNWMGSAGFVWGFGLDPESFPKKSPRCYACIIYRSRESNSPNLLLQEIQTAELPSGVLRIERTNTLSMLPIEIPANSLVPFEITVTETRVTARLNQEADRELAFVDRIARKNMVQSFGKVGLIVRGKTAIISDPSVFFEDIAKDE